MLYLRTATAIMIKTLKIGPRFPKENTSQWSFHYMGLKYLIFLNVACPVKLKVGQRFYATSRILIYVIFYFTMKIKMAFDHSFDNILHLKGEQ